MNTITHPRRRFAANAAAFAAITTAAFSAAACGSETSSDTTTEPAAPASAVPTATSTPHAPTSADSAERQGAANEKRWDYITGAPGGHEVPVP